MTPDRPDPYTSFAAFAEACQPRLQRAAYLICGDQHLAEDLVQSALVKVALRWRQLHNGHPEAYLRTILYRDAVSWWRRQRREFPMAHPPEQRTADGSEAAQLRMIFKQELARLTTKQRAVLVLRFFEDCSEARTAEVLGVAVGTVKSQTAVALRRLRELAPELSDLVARSARSERQRAPQSRAKKTGLQSEGGRR